MAIFGALVAMCAVVGLAIGRLVAPALTRWSERQDEEPGDEPDDRA
jgi:hypothetical protein